MPRSKSLTYPAPSSGWFSNMGISGSSSAAADVLDNCIPTQYGARPRGGSSLHATTDDAVRDLFVYRSSTEKMFAATDDAIYDVTSPANAEVAPTASVSSLSAADWSAQNFSTAGGEFLTLVNGTDSAQQFNGTSWSNPTINNVSSSALSHVWSFKNRMWFVEGGTTSAWYLATNAVSGDATEFPLAGVFSAGGALLFGATWSLDAGDGIDDVIVFVSTLGEVAIYQGTDPSSDFALSGVYQMGAPLGKNGYFKAGGDLAVATTDGIVSISDVLNKDRAALKARAVSMPIADAWDAAAGDIVATKPMHLTHWQDAGILFVGTPARFGGLDVSFVANTSTGAWGRVLGWDARCATVYDGRLFFGTASGTVVEGDVGGSDQGTAYTCLWVPRFTENNPTRKVAQMARFRGRATDEYTIGLGCFADFEVSPLSGPVNGADTSGDVWGTGVWGTMVWGGGGTRQSVSDWQSVSAFGTDLSPAVAITMNRTSKPDLEFTALDFLYEEGSAI